MELKDILVRPLSTEKSVSQLGSEQTYAFEVGLKANKVQIKRAIEAFYGVEVDRVIAARTLDPVAVIQAAVEPDRGVERPVLVHQQVGQLRLEGVGILLGRKIPAK